jgi:hypothetical protein
MHRSSRSRSRRGRQRQRGGVEGGQQALDVVRQVLVPLGLEVARRLGEVGARGNGSAEH